MSYLKMIFTDDFAVWERNSELHGHPLLEMTPTDGIAVVNLSRLTGTVSTLPTALYLCCQLDIELVKGIPRGDIQETLAIDDVERCLAGKTLLMRASTQTAWDNCKIRGLERHFGMKQVLRLDSVQHIRRCIFEGRHAGGG
ncbi:hypothetical protein A0H81_04752 [Grifola frondosa]|uniref:Uncharacterized protein n=1 Tax=Grifola frondosa TaxID=5627 RepID=A0A1C7MGG3_GRIFR|nr:hypothetical protein A0H81_04752 [Grifola frondosa]